MIWYWAALGCQVFEDLSMWCLSGAFTWGVPW